MKDSAREIAFSLFDAWCIAVMCKWQYLRLVLPVSTPEPDWRASRRPVTVGGVSQGTLVNATTHILAGIYTLQANLVAAQIVCMEL